MVRSDRSYGAPHYSLERVHMAVALRRVIFTTKALQEARILLPSGTVGVAAEITDVVGRLDEEEFEFAQERDGQWVDVYKTVTYGTTTWIKIKLETDPAFGEELVVISFHKWDETRPV